MQKVDEQKRTLTIDNLSSYQEALWYQNTLATDSIIVQLMDSLQVEPVAISEKNFDNIQTTFTLQEYRQFEQDSLQQNIPKAKRYATFVKPKTNKPKTVTIIDGTVGLKTPTNDTIANDTTNITPTSTTKQDNQAIPKNQHHTKQYKNLYTYQPNVPHYVVFYILPTTPYDYSTIKKALDTFNQENYRIINLNVSEKSLHQQSIVQITAFNSVEIAKSYLLRLLKDQHIKKATSGVNKRNLIITKENLDTLLQSKELDIYFEFMKTYYFK